MAGSNYVDNWSNHYGLKTELAFPAQGLIRIMKDKYPKLPEITKFGTSLDLGCGDGRNTNFLMQLGFKSWGVEISSSITENLTQLLPGCNFKVGTNSKIPFGDNYFDLIVAWNAIYYLGDVTDTIQLMNNLKECYRVINKKNTSSVFVLTIPCPSSFIFNKSLLVESNNGIQVRKIMNDPFGLRNGELLSTFDSKNTMQHSLHEVGFSSVTIGEELGDWFGHTYDWWIGVCKL